MYTRGVQLLLGCKAWHGCTCAAVQRLALPTRLHLQASRFTALVCVVLCVLQICYHLLFMLLRVLHLATAPRDYAPHSCTISCLYIGKHGLLLVLYLSPP